MPNELITIILGPKKQTKSLSFDIKIISGPVRPCIKWMPNE